MSRRLVQLLVVLMFLAGLGILFYPALSNWVASRNSSRAIQEYTYTVEDMTADQIEEQKELAREYNGLLTGQGITDPFVPNSGFIVPDEYRSILNIGGVMAHINIPQIGVALPIYHGTSEKILQKAVGHMEATAFPIGGEGTHCVLTGHRGLPTAELFTNLDKVALGDVFYITVLDETLAYEVDQILVVEPQDTNPLRPVPGEDYVTLITCTPYAVNSHRLFVRGTRIPYDAAQELSTVSVTKILVAIAIAVGVVGGTITFLVIRKNRKRQKLTADKTIYQQSDEWER